MDASNCNGISAESKKIIMILSDSEDEEPETPAENELPIMQEENVVADIASIESSDSDDDIIFVPLKPKQHSKENGNEAKQADINSSQESDDISIRPRIVEKPHSESEESSEEYSKPKVVKKRKRNTLKSKKAGGKRRKRIKMHERDSDDGGSDTDAIVHQNVYDSDDDEDGDAVAPPTRAVLACRDAVLSLLNTGTDNELVTIKSMNPAKIELIKENRPFEDWLNVVNCFHTTKGLKPDMLNSISQVIVARKTVLKIMEKCEEMARKTRNATMSRKVLVQQQPALIPADLTLASYQMIGLNWLALMRKSELNSILADEMGLGKTIQVIAFFAYLKENDYVHKDIPHLVVVPSSTLDNWWNELAKWCPSLSVEVYGGSFEDKLYLRRKWVKEGFGDAEVILTTYSSISSPEEKKLFRLKEFNYIVFDEAHMLKNMNTTRYKTLKLFNGNYKILLTGTPLQNNLLELMSLLTFLMPELFEHKIHFIQLLFSKYTPNTECSSQFEVERIEQAKSIIEPFILRRFKRDVLKDLPTKTLETVKCDLLESQSAKYAALLAEFKDEFAAKNSNCYMMYVMMLRKLANHPLLLKYYFNDEMLLNMSEILATDPNYKGKTAEYIHEDLRILSDFELHRMCKTYETLHDLNYKLDESQFLESGKLRKLDALLPKMKADGHRVIIFSQFILLLDLLEEYCALRNHAFLRFDGSTAVNERQDLIDVFNRDSSIFIFLLSTKAGGLGINLTSADRVIIHDVDYNPYNDKQAEDRCHRVGQTRPVHVYKLIAADTIEEHINQIAQNKLHLEREISAVDDDSNETKSVLQMLKDTLGLHDT